MRTNSGAGEGKNNNHDSTLRDHEGKRGPAQQSALLDRDDDDRPGGGPSDSRQGRDKK